MKEGDNSNISQKLWSKKRSKIIGTSKEREDIALVCLTLDERFTIFFSHVFAFAQGLKDETYPAMDSPDNGESDGVSCIPVEDCI